MRGARERGIKKRRKNQRFLLACVHNVRHHHRAARVEKIDVYFMTRVYKNVYRISRQTNKTPTESAFYKIDQVLRRKICGDWLVGRLGIAEVVKRLGIARAQFLACVKEDAFQRDYLPPVILEAYELWKTRKMTKFEAARHCKMGMTTFNDCLRKMGKSTISLGSSHDAELLYARAIRLYQQGVVTQSAAARLCETSSVVFFRRLQADGANNVVFEDFMPAPHAFPKGFCTAYRSYVRGQMRAQEAAESCSMTYDAFLEWVRKVEHGEDLEKAQALFDQKVLQWQNGEISKMQLLRDIGMNSARFNHYCEQKQIVKFKKTKAQKA